MFDLQVFCVWSGCKGDEIVLVLKEMKGVSWGLIVGITIGVVIGVLLATGALFCIRYRKRRSQIGSSSSRRASTVPIRANGVDVCTILSDSTIGQESPKLPETNGASLWVDGPKRKNVISASGVLKYSYKYCTLLNFNNVT